MRGLQETQQDHDARLRNLERRQDEDSRVKSVWGGNSPFPSGLTGATSNPPGMDFSSFDDDNSTNMMRSLQLDTDDPPRRLGATSRANSVRFDESANQNQWSHNSRASGEFITRSSSGLGGGFPLFERSTSHKSEGRQSSAGHSMSGRANSLGFDITGSMQGNADDNPGVAPGLFLLGTVPAIIRCWMNTDYTHDSLLYAAVCTGSYRSFLDERIIHDLGYDSMIKSDIRGTRKIKLPLYLPEAVPSVSSSRASSPSHQLSCPSVVVDFNVLEAAGDLPSPKAIQIFLGSDMLRAHNADILFSSNSMTMVDSNRDKLAVPFVRPEDEAAFKGLYITTTARQALDGRCDMKPAQSLADLTALANGHDLHTRSSSPESKSTDALDPSSKPTSTDFRRPAPRSPSITSTTSGRRSLSRKPSLTALNTSANNGTASTAPHPSSSATSATAPTTAIWSNWRRDGSQPPAGATANPTDWGARTRRETGIKVLKPTRQASRTASSATTAAAPAASAASTTAPASAASVTSDSPTAGQASRFFDEGGKRRGVAGAAAAAVAAVGGDVGERGAKGRGVGNPIGGASAFGWLNGPR
ncbi:hypothetical protein FH972_023775 [Carpinus fangiana]|uniref:Uncharacterized protein n=1 Tax=Carpinus fangiana TaxID=176857 RepID=A0A5N6KW66_9ROSI|nr:hypothetical protein FH972_023775 [Carpinus fangiana]